jgi:hypothetical protein
MTGSLREEAFMLAPRAVVASTFGSIAEAFRGWVRQRRLINECRRRFDGCDSYEIDRIAKDVGLSPGELRQMAKLRPDAAKLLLDRMAAQHLDAQAIDKSDPSTMRDMQRLCSSCAAKKRCQRDLITDRDNPVWRQYCPNSGTLGALGAQFSNVR